MKFGRLIGYNMRNIFLEKLYKKCAGEASSRPFYKKSESSISLDQQSEMLQFVFIVCPSQGLPKYIKTKVLSACFYFV